MFDNILSNVLLNKRDDEDTCSTGNSYNGRLGLRISAVFVIMFGSMFGALFPLLCSRVPRIHMPKYVYLFCRYFGSGVIVATAFIHLLSPAEAALNDSCLGGVWADYDWAAGIMLISIWSIFLVDLLAGRYVEQKYGVSGEHHVPHMESVPHHDHDHGSGSRQNFTIGHDHNNAHDPTDEKNIISANPTESPDRSSYINSVLLKAELERQIAAFLVLEFGVIFHSVIIGLALAVSGDEFITLFVVITFHQTFEGLGLGSRLSTLPYPPGTYQPWILGLAYGFVTPIAIAIGICLRSVYDPASRNGLIVSGVLDSLSAGILIYTGLVELLAHDFIYNKDKRTTKVLVAQLVCALLGSLVMALLGRWA